MIWLLFIKNNNKIIIINNDDIYNTVIIIHKKCTIIWLKLINHDTKSIIN